MHTIEAKSGLMFEVKNLLQSRKGMFHVPDVMLYPVQELMEPLSKDLQECMEYLDTVQLVNKLWDDSPRNGAYEPVNRGKGRKVYAMERGSQL